MTQQKLFYQIARGGLVVIPVSGEDSGEKYSVAEVTFDFSVWNTIQIPDFLGRDLRGVEKSLPVQVASLEWGSDLTDYGVQKISEPLLYRVNCRKDQVSGREEVSVFRLLEERQKHVKIVPASVIWWRMGEEDFSMDPATERFFRLLEKESV